MTTTVSEPPPLPVQSGTPPLPISVQLGRAVLGLAGFGAGLLFLFLVVPALALHVLASLYSLIRGIPAEPLAISFSGSHLDYAISLLSGLSFLGMIRGRRCRWAHRLGAFCLAYWGIAALTSNAMQIRAPHLTADQGLVLGQALSFALMLLLFWRFSFGRASRRCFS